MATAVFGAPGPTPTPTPASVVFDSTNPYNLPKSDMNSTVDTPSADALTLQAEQDARYASAPVYDAGQVLTTSNSVAAFGATPAPTQAPVATPAPTTAPTATTTSTAGGGGLVSIGTGKYGEYYLQDGKPFISGYGLVNSFDDPTPVSSAQASAVPSGTAWTALDTIDWSASNTANATKQLWDSMQANGWTMDQVAAKYGFSAAQMQSHFAKYGYGSAPASTAPTGDAWTALDKIDWSAANTANATKQLWDAAMANGWTLEQLGAKYGFTADQMRAHFLKYGLGGAAPAVPPEATGPGTTSGGSTSSTGTFNLDAMGKPTYGEQPIVGPKDWTVDANQTVASQLEQILKADSPLMQLARTRAQQQANASGLSNSTMAGTAGEAAMIDKALPIAQQDASTFGDAAQYNAGSANTFGRDANAFSRDRSTADFNLAANDWASARGFTRSEQAADSAAGRSNTMANANLAREQELAKTNAALNVTQNATTQAQTLERGYVNALNQARADYADALTNISASKDMESGLKTETLTNLRNTYNTVISNYAKLLGWDAASWIIGDAAADTPGATPAPTAAPVNPVFEVAGGTY